MSSKERLSTIILKFTGCAEDLFAESLQRQMETHEGVTFMDLLKFLYQSSLGSFHLFEMMDETELRGWIKRNLARTRPSDGPLIEELNGKKWVRVNFGPYKKRFGDDYQRIFQALLEAKRMKRSQSKEYMDLLKKLVDVIGREEIKPLSEEPTFLSLVESFLREYEEEDFPPIHHSHAYKLRNSCDYLVVPYLGLQRAFLDKNVK